MAFLRRLSNFQAWFIDSTVLWRVQLQKSGKIEKTH